MVGRCVSAAAVNFSATAHYFRNAEVTGVPVRPEIFALPPRTAIQPPRLLGTAGSQGARIFNDRLPKIAPALLAAVPGLTIVHQAGARHLETTRAAFAASGADPGTLAVEAFLENMPAEYGAADLCLARAGSTVARLCAAGGAHRCSSHSPLQPTITSEKTQRCWLTQAPPLDAAGARRYSGPPVSVPRDLPLHPAPRAKMAAHARALAKPGALERIAGMVLRLAH